MAANLEEKTISKSKETFQKEVEGLKKKIIENHLWRHLGGMKYFAMR